jgi:selenocysteine-specific elongation factor
MQVVATAGHVDHGKSTLVEALTGTDPDRLTEEKTRGLTIDLGFAHTVLPSGRAVAFVDVPGHIRFVGNMLAGAGVLATCLLVVDASEGWKAQSEEHLQLMELLGFHAGVVAMSKVDRVEPTDRLSLACSIRQRLQGTFLAEANIIPVSARTGAGLDALVGTLDAVLATAPGAADRGRPRLWVDRAFTIVGAGTVVTGTLTGGPLRIGEALEVGHRRIRVRVRGLESLGQRYEMVEPGWRVAVNLAGASHQTVSRGDALVRPGQWHLSTMVDASLRVRADLPHSVTRRGSFRVHIGSSQRSVGLTILGPSVLHPGEAGPVRLRLASPLPLLPGDRYVLRESGRAETVGGGEILDVDPVLPASRAHPTKSVSRVISERQWIEFEELERLTGQRVSPTVAGKWVVDPTALRVATSELLHRIDQAGPSGLNASELDERHRSVLLETHQVTVVAGRAYRGEGLPQGAVLPEPARRWLAALSDPSTESTDPTSFGVDLELAKDLRRKRLVLRLDGLDFSATALEQATLTVGRLFATSSEGVTVAQVRDAIGTSRKRALALLSYLDSVAFTRRVGDLRIAGQRLPTNDSSNQRALD